MAARAFRSTRRVVGAATCAALVVCGLFVMSMKVLDDSYARAQAAVGTDLRRAVLGPTADRTGNVRDEAAARERVETIRADTIEDTVFAVGYLLIGTTGVWLALTARRRRSDLGALDVIAICASVLGPSFDIAENTALRRLLPLIRSGETFGQRDDILRACGSAKWAFLCVAAVVTLWRVTAPSVRPAITQQAPTAPPPWRRPGSWDAPPVGEERLGVCCSGGGIRSAAFSLGALQVLDGKGVLRRARYLAAVSGGGYIAAGLHVANRLLPRTGAARGLPPAQTPRPFMPGSPEERYFRNNSSYLVPSFLKALPGVGAALFGLAVNLMVIALVLFVVARPVGWLIGAAHPELRAVKPIAVADRATAQVEVDTVEPADGYEVAGETVDIYAVRVRGVPSKPACMDLYETERGSSDIAFTVRSSRPALVEVRGTKATVIRQPAVVPIPIDTADVAEAEESCSIRAGSPTVDMSRIRVDRQPSLSVDPDVTISSEEELRAQLSISTSPIIRPHTGLRGRERITIDAAQVTAVAVPAALAVLAAGAAALLRLQRGWRRAVRTIQHAAASVAVAALLLLIVLPTLTQALPGWLAEVTEAATGAKRTSPLGWGLPAYVVPGGGFVLLASSLLRRLFTANKPAADKEASLAGRLWAKFTGSSKALSWYELSPAKILAGVGASAVVGYIFLSYLVYASANGPGGKLLGFELIQREIPSTYWPHEWGKLVLAIAALLGLSQLVDAHAWSLHPFYKRRLSDTYLLQRDRTGTTAAPVPYDSYPLRFEPIDSFPELILGCAVNISDVGATPPGRRAASFTFSASEIGGPLVGYIHPDHYWNKLGKARRKDITVPSAMAISGAAFSPAMGKFNLGPVGAIYAIANLRLGVWLPHPAYVTASSLRWIHRPGWSWYLREIVNRYRQDAPYLYVSDGGHWENLGVVELLRRGCTQIVCVNAGGDRQENFGTIGEAIAIAREELGVEFIDFDPTALRPPVKADEKGRLLRREGTKDAPTPLATTSYAEAAYRFPDGRPGRLWLIEPALNPKMPFDVHVYAESALVFPDDSTADQVFNHRQFESFRALGAQQTEALFGPGATARRLLPRKSGSGS